MMRSLRSVSEGHSTERRRAVDKHAMSASLDSFSWTLTNSDLVSDWPDDLSVQWFFTPLSVLVPSLMPQGQQVHHLLREKREKKAHTHQTIVPELREAGRTEGREKKNEKRERNERSRKRWRGACLMVHMKQQRQHLDKKELVGNERRKKLVGKEERKNGEIERECQLSNIDKKAVNLVSFPRALVFFFALLSFILVSRLMSLNLLSHAYLICVMPKLQTSLTMTLHIRRRWFCWFVTMMSSLMNHSSLLCWLSIPDKLIRTEKANRTATRKKNRQRRKKSTTWIHCFLLQVSFLPSANLLFSHPVCQSNEDSVVLPYWNSSRNRFETGNKKHKQNVWCACGDFRRDGVAGGKDWSALSPSLFFLLIFGKRLTIQSEKHPETVCIMTRSSEKMIERK